MIDNNFTSGIVSFHVIFEKMTILTYLHLQTYISQKTVSSVEVNPVK